MNDNRCIECEHKAQWIRSTQFAGNHPFCDYHARLESDFSDSDSYLYWRELDDEQ
jgi:hypothetical protein